MKEIDALVAELTAVAAELDQKPFLSRVEQTERATVANGLHALSILREEAELRGGDCPGARLAATFRLRAERATL